jgi:hypothetical protein
MRISLPSSVMAALLLVLLCCCSNYVTAFAPQKSAAALLKHRITVVSPQFQTATKLHLLPVETASSLIEHSHNMILLADGSPDWGLFEGRTLSLLHPITMFSMLGLSIYTALLGFQWRRQRTIGDDISELKKSLPKIEQGSYKEALSAAKETNDSKQIALYENAISAESEIASLTAERKELSQKNVREAHFNRGALLACIGTIFAIEVCNNIIDESSRRSCIIYCAHISHSYIHRAH